MQFAASLREPHKAQRGISCLHVQLKTSGNRAGLGLLYSCIYVVLRLYYLAGSTTYDDECYGGFMKA